MTKKFSPDFIKEHIVAAVLILFMAVVYIYNMFTNKPWYDELYTYYYFISRGPIYAAIHWPVPNNHVGYSVVSAFLDYLGNPYIGLRGISCIAAIANLILIYKLSYKFMNKWYSVAATALYAGTYLVFRLAFQGRGYTLSTTCLLVAILAAYRVALGDCRIKNYFFFAAALTFGLYIVPSSIYWVIPVCITGGLYLLIQKRYRDLWHLVLSGIIAALATLFLYMLIWLAIGANLVSKDASSSFYGISQVKIILKAPFLAAKTGIDYMLATPYIQSIDRFECIRTMPEYFISLLGNFYDRAGLAVFILYIAVAILSVISLIMLIRHRENFFLSLFISCGLILVPIMLIVQSVHPYLRVLSFLAVFLFIGLVYMLNQALELIKRDSLLIRCGYVLAGCTILITVINCVSPFYRSPLATRENDIQAALAKMDNPTDIDNIFYADDFQKYVLKFYYDVTPNEVYALEAADFVMTGPEFSDPSNEVPTWPVLYGYSKDMEDYVKGNMTELVHTDSYSIYKK
ncbi:glycosyltransferase family 39 protein [Butyrivibrio sp. VCB2006]|uniref:glycosyltransferase family 39 protein n=1 Tax=Butyrivibrio sp. VCB2006 TaxID=1280679 RepID=UPI0003FD1AF6|nr:glycosyltransferase family 39 protein [Butyrivibrio sp. VCB2006]